MLISEDFLEKYDLDDINIDDALEDLTNEFQADECLIYADDYNDLYEAKSILSEYYSIREKEKDGCIGLFCTKKKNNDDDIYMGYCPDLNPANSPVSNFGVAEDLEDDPYYEEEEEHEELDCPACGGHSLSFIEWQGNYALYNCDNCGEWFLADEQGNINHPEEIYTEDIEKHSELNQKIFDDNNELKPEVKEKLQEIADKFIENLEKDDVNIDVKDLRVVGSNASYNYTKDSDIDLHLIVDTSKFGEYEDLAQKLYNAYKSLWNDKYDPTIYGMEVEVYVEPQDQPAKSNGIYSLDDGWVKEPEQETIPDDIDVTDEVLEWEDKAEKCKTVEDIEQFFNDIYTLRQSGLLEGGEYSKGNLIFKELRNHGILQELKQLKVDLTNDELSLEGING